MKLKPIETMTDQTNEIAQSPNPALERRQQLAALIPEAFSEGQLDVAALKRALGTDATIDGGERYALTWAGKANAYKVLRTPSRATAAIVVSLLTELVS